MNEGGGVCERDFVLKGSVEESQLDALLGSFVCPVYVDGRHYMFSSDLLQGELSSFVARTNYGESMECVGLIGDDFTERVCGVSLKECPYLSTVCLWKRKA